MRNLIFLAGVLAPATAFAQALGLDYGLVTACPINDLSCSTGVTFEPFERAFDIMRTVVFPAVLFAMFVFYGFKMVVRSQDEGAQGEVKLAFSQALFGTALVGGAFLIASSFAVPSDTDVVTPGGLNSVLNSLAGTLVMMVFTAVVVNIFIQGYRLITAQEEGDMDSARKQLIYGALGGAVAILAVSVVTSFFDVDIGILNNEAVGIGNYIVTIFGAVAVIGIIIAGIMLIISVDEQLKDRARKLLLISLITLVIVIAAYAIIKFFADITIPTTPTPPAVP